MCFLSPEEIVRLANAVDDRYRVFIYTTAYTGMRWGEVVGLKVSRVNFLRGVIEIKEAMTELRGKQQLGPTKTGKVRSVSMPKFLVHMLAEHLAKYPSNDYVFTAAEGGAIRKHWARRHFKPALVKADLNPKLRFHDLRHTCAALLIAQGAHPKEIQERLGHSTIRLTFDRYGPLFPTLHDRLRQALEFLWQQAAASDI